jgi:hypothetical protein
VAERLTTLRRAVPGDAAALAEFGARTFREQALDRKCGFEDRGEKPFILGTDRQTDREWPLRCHQRDLAPRG